MFRPFEIKIENYDEVKKFNLQDLVSEETINKYHTALCYVPINEEQFLEYLMIEYPDYTEKVIFNKHDMQEVDYIFYNYKNKIKYN